MKDMSIPLLAAVSSSTEETVRPIADFHPTLWGNHFLKSAADVETIDAATQEQHAALKQEVRRMITTTANKLAQKLHMIDAVQRLGVAYHFEKEIEDELGKVSHDLDSDDLYVVSLRFRLFRQQGVKISCDVFEKFKDDEGKFKESLINDIRGMLSLYEAAYLAIRGEDILDEAIVFTTTHLKSVISVSDHSHVNSNLAEQIRHSLQIPLRKAAARLEARYFLDIYSRDDLHDETLLKFAKLDFNILQAAHQKEASIMTRWWNDLGFPKKVPYARDRIVEIYIWMLLGVSYEPKLAFGRTFASKVICMISIIDDTFDAYSTFEELTLFTEAVTRWDIGLIDTLPEYMKFIFKALLDIYREAEEELAKERRSYGISYAKQTVSNYFISIDVCLESNPERDLKRRRFSKGKILTLKAKAMPKAQNPSVFSSSSFHHTRILSTILTQFTSPKTQLPTQTNCLLHFKKLVVTNNLLLLLRLLSLLQWS